MKRGRFLVYATFTSVFLTVQSLLNGCTSLFLKIPEPLKSAGIELGAGRLSKKPFFTDSGLGTITAIHLRKTLQNGEPQMIVAGLKGAAWIDSNAKGKKTIFFDRRTSHINVIDADSDSNLEYYDRGGHGWADAALFNASGKTLWTYGGTSGVDDMCAGDLNGDGKMEFVVGFNGGGIHLLNHDKKVHWVEPGCNEWSVEMVDTDGDGTLEIVDFNCGYLVVRDKTGKIIHKAQTDQTVVYFSICSWPTKKSQSYILTFAYDPTIRIIGFDGKTVTQFNAPKSNVEPGKIWGLPVKLKKDEPEYFAALVDFDHCQRSIFYLYDSTGTLIYWEILPESCKSIVAMPTGQSDTETILVGGDGKVWKYEAAKL